MDANIEQLMGQTIIAVEGKVGDETMTFTLNDGRKFRMFHSQDCCESVAVEDICGDLSDLIGSPIVQAEEVSNNENPPGVTKEYEDESFTWTFYKLGTAKGGVTIRWYGSSNGYYGEGVDCMWV